jgi:hypothetical protein
MPFFITLGHELGHAYHNLTGQICDAFILPTGYPAEFAEQSLWSTPEEYQNITKNENPLRAKHGLPLRKYHRDYAAVCRVRRLKQLKERMEQVDQQIAALQEKDPTHTNLFQQAVTIQMLMQDVEEPGVLEEVEEKVAQLEEILGIEKQSGKGKSGSGKCLVM